MKFLCDNCKAKYQIPDEKITGRTLRMKCRKCDHDIIIRGETAEARPSVMASTMSVPASAFPSAASQLPIARSRTSGTGVPPRAANALGADFQRRVATGAPELPTAAAESPKLWHVAINDVPVGPIRRDEMAKKIGTGEVTGESLCWREGFDDWRPVSEVADLASLLDQRRPPAIKPFEPAPPPPSTEDDDDFGDNEATVVGASPLLREMQEREEREEREREEKKRAAALAAAKPAPAREPSGKIPVAKRTDSTSGVARPAPSPAPKLAAVPAPVVAEAPARVDTVTPSPVVLQPVAAPVLAPAATPAAATPAAATPAAAAPAAVVAPAPATPAARPAVADSIPPTKKRKPLGVGAWMGIAGTFGFGVTMAIMIGRSLTPQPVAPTPAPVVATATPEAPTPAARTDLDTDVEGPVADPSELAATPTPTPNTRPTGTTPHATTGTASTRPATNGTATAPTAALTPEQRALIDRMGASSSEPSPTANITVPTTMDTASGAGRAPLSASDLGAVVNRNKIQLQRCHERALRGMSSAPAVRMDVSLSVSAAGTVTTATAAGTDFGGLKSCIEQTVRRWRFPESSGGGATRFPVVFQAVN